ncbi:MAG: saccharopine dehydrogenase family protein [Candidatus Hodarchaeota archaeon]
MVNYAVLGLGLMGSAICFDLLTHDPSSKIYGFDIDPNQGKSLTEKFASFNNRFKALPLALEMTDEVENHLLVETFRKNDIAVVFGAIDYKFNVFLSKLCIRAGCSYVDLGGNPAVVSSQKNLHTEAIKADVTIIPDLGLAPGMVNIIAAYGMSKFDELHECHLRVGGLPQKPRTLLKYQKIFSIRGLTNEYLEEAIIIRNRKKITVPSLSEKEIIEFPDPWGKLEAFQTAGGSSSLPDLFENKIDELTYKTIRYPGHCQFFRLLKDIGLLSSEKYPKNPKTNPRELVEYYLARYLPKGDPDVVLVRIMITGIIDGQTKNHRYQLIDFMDQKTGYSAMARTTAFPTSIIGQFIGHGKIKIRGVIPGEITVPLNDFIKELEKRNIIFKFKELN